MIAIVLTIHTVMVACLTSTLVSSLQTSTWQALAVDDNLSTLNAQWYWQRTDFVQPYPASNCGSLSIPCMQLVLNSSFSEAYNGGAWSTTSTIPVFQKSMCASRQITVSFMFEYTFGNTSLVNQFYGGPTGRLGLGDDSIMYLNLTGMAYGLATGINMAYYTTPNVDFLHPNGIVGTFDLRQVCGVNTDPVHCQFFERTDLAYERGGVYNATIVATINGTTGMMAATSFYVYDKTRSQVLININASQLTTAPTISAQRWLNVNGSTTSPIVFVASRATNISVYQLDVVLSDTCSTTPFPTPQTTAPRTPRVTPAPTVPLTGTTINTATLQPTPMSTTTTDSVSDTTLPSLTTVYVASSTTVPSVDTSSTAQETTSNATDTSAISVPHLTSAQSNTTLPYAPYALSSVMPERDYTALIVVGTLICLCILCIVPLCVFRRRVASTRAYATIYSHMPRRLWICCLPRMRRGVSWCVRARLCRS